MPHQIKDFLDEILYFQQQPGLYLEQQNWFKVSNYFFCWTTTGQPLWKRTELTTVFMWVISTPLLQTSTSSRPLLSDWSYNSKWQSVRGSICRGGGERSATWQHSGRRKETDCQLFVTLSLRWLIRATRTGVTVHGGHGAPCYVGFGVTAWYEFSTTWKRLQIIQKSIKFCFIYFQQTAGEVGLFHPVPLDTVGTVCSGLQQQGRVVGRGRNHGVTQDMIRLTIHYPP